MDRNTSKLIQFPGYFELGEERKARFVSRIEYELHDPSILKIDFLLLGDENDQKKASSYLQNLKYNYVWLYSEDDHVPSVEVFGIHRITTGRSEASIGATAIQVGLSNKLLEHDAKYIVKVELMPSGILGKAGIRELSYTGDISFRSIVDGVVEVSSQLGTLQAEEQFDHYESEEYGNRIIHTVERAAITATLEIPKDRNLYEINEILRSDVEDICLILSLCYRQPVDYYEIRYTPDPEHSKERQLQEAFLRIKHEAPVSKIGRDELINYRNLVGGGLDRLVRSYRDSKRKDDLKRGIRFLSSSFRIVTLESSYFLAYSALESVVSAIGQGERFLLSSGKWKKVEKLFREHLDQIAESEGFGNVVSQMKEKLPELRRAPSNERIKEVCTTLGVETQDLWPREGFDTGLDLAAKTRNDLFHSASCKNPQELFKNLVRLRTLTERIILKGLKWPNDHIWVWYDQDLKWINKG